MALLLLLGLSAAAGMTASPASATQDDTNCACQFTTVASQVRAAEVIFTGVVSEARRVPVLNRPKVFNDIYSAQVESIYKGDVEAEATLRTDRAFGVCGSNLFEPGTRVMFFGDAGPQGRPDVARLQVLGCGGTAPATDALVARVEGILGKGRPAVPPEPFTVTFTAPADQPGPPPSITRLAAPGLALVIIAGAALFFVRRLGRSRR